VAVEISSCYELFEGSGLSTDLILIWRVEQKQLHSANQNDDSHDAWIATPHLAPDFRGPQSSSFLRFIDPAIAPPIVQLLGSVSVRQPDRVAFEDDSGSNFTFAEFWRAVNRLAADIDNTQTSGPIGILLPTGTLYAIAVFACLAARRVSLLLDENYPEERNAEIAGRANVGLLLVSTNLSQSGFWSRFVVRNVAAALNDTAIDPEITGGALELDAPAFILATSGSAGRPKAIVHSQRTMLHWVRTLHDAMHIWPDDRVLSVSSPSSLGGFTSLLTFPLAGASAQMFEIKQSGLGGLLEILRSRPITILRAAPSLLRALCQHGDLAKSAMTRLRIAQTYGEPLLKADVTELQQRLSPSCLIRTTYGSTEASGLSWFAGERDDYDPVRVATGTLMPDTRALIIDDLGRPCNRSDVGELLIASRYNALGEWSEEGLIPGSLQPDPADPRVRIFRTGDVARCSPDGVFVVLGRKDRMAKINGQRVEMSEVETALRRLDSVSRAEVMVQEEDGKVKLVAFVVPHKPTSDGLPQRLRRQLSTSLPPFMIPSRIVLLDSVPCLPGGKVDATALLRLLDS
jgi:acyl-coenzyme A synthetase/AMP-(fatty) acid ligase